MTAYIVILGVYFLGCGAVAGISPLTLSLAAWCAFTLLFTCAWCLISVTS